MKHIIFYGAPGKEWAKSHACTDALFEPLLTNLRRLELVPTGVVRYGTEANCEQTGQEMLAAKCDGTLVIDVDTVDIDLGGIVGRDSPVMQFSIGSNTYEILAEQALQVLMKLRELHPREFDGGRSYYKLNGRWLAIVMSPEHREALIEQLVSRRSEIERLVSGYSYEHPQVRNSSRMVARCR